MGIYDNLVLSQDLSLDSFPLNLSNRVDGRPRWWQTKDLHPSMDMYAIIPAADLGGSEYQDKDDEDRYYLCRRHPPVTKWTNVNEGMISDTDENVIYDADHWRTVRFTGTLNLSETARDGRLYDISAEVDSGILDSLTFESSSSPIDMTHPEPPYNTVLDLDPKVPAIQGVGMDIEELAESIYEQNEEIDELSERIGLDNKQIVLCLNYYNIQYED